MLGYRLQQHGGSPMAQSKGADPEDLSLLQTQRRILVSSAGVKDVGSLTRYDETAVTTDWQKKLTPKQFYIMREKGTEMMLNLESRMYHRVYCNAPLFRTEKKYNSGTGWPSFSEAFGACGTDECNANILRRPDTSLGSTSTEVICKQCDVGHVFDDGPRPSGQKVLYQQCLRDISLKQRLVRATDPRNSKLCSGAIPDLPPRKLDFTTS
ncbi:unnamed protein product [Caretta caretta]